MILERVQAIVNSIAQEFHHRFADKAKQLARIELL